MFKKLVVDTRKMLSGGIQSHPIGKLQFHIGYAAQCGFPDRENKDKPTTKDMTLCFWRDTRISQLQPRLIVPMGKLACQALGMKFDNFNKIRGTECEALIEGKIYKVLPMLHPAAPYLQPGLVPMFMRDIRKALLTAAVGTQESQERLQDLIQHYEYPNSTLAIKELSERIIHYSNSASATPPLAVDTETNTLGMHLDDVAKCIAFSVAWDKTKSAAWLMNHKALAAEQGADAWWYRLPYVFNILMCPKAKIMHNGGFDLRVFRHLVRMLVLRVSQDAQDADYRAFFEKECHHTVEEIVRAEGIVNFAYDSMLGEHANNEDCRGFYSLKSIVQSHCPAFYGYENTLQQEKGEEYHLKTVADFQQHVAQLPEFVKRADSLQYTHAWLEAIKSTPHYDEDLPDVPEIFAEALLPQITREDTWKRMKAAAKPVFTRARKRVKAWLGKLVQSGSEGKLSDTWKAFKKDPASRDFICEQAGISAEDRSRIEWYLWFQKHKGKDLLKAEIKAAAAELKTAVEQDRSTINFENFDPQELLTYAAIDTDTVLYCAESQLAIYNKEEAEKPSIRYRDASFATSYTALRTNTLPMTIPLSHMTDNGIKLDYDYIERTEQALNEQASQAEQRILELTGVGRVFNGLEVNLNSTDQLASLLVNAGLEEYLTERTPKGKVRLSKDVLKVISKALGEEAGDAPIDKLNLAQLILLYRESTKATGSFLKNFRKFGENDGYLHPSFHQIGTATYRLSSSKPAAQTLPQKLARHNIKKCLIPSRPDYCICNTDASGAEIKTLTAYLAQMSGPHKGQDLIAAMNADIKFDIHSRFAAFVFADLLGLDVSTPEKWEEAYLWVRLNKDLDKAVDALRKKVKAVVFGTLYGQTARGLSGLLGIPLEDAEEIIRKFYAADPSIAAYVQWSGDFAVNHGYINTIFGHRRRFPLANIDKKHQSRTRRQSGNFLIQSTTVTVFNTQIAEFQQALTHELNGRPLLQVHDALVFEIPIAKLRQAQHLVKYWFTERVSEKYPWFPVPFVCDLEAGDSYGELMHVDKYIAMKEGEGATIHNFILDEDRDQADRRLLLIDEDPDQAYTIDPHGVWEDEGGASLAA